MSGDRALFTNLSSCHPIYLMIACESVIVSSASAFCGEWWFS